MREAFRLNKAELENCISQRHISLAVMYVYVHKEDESSDQIHKSISILNRRLVQLMLE